MVWAPRGFSLCLMCGSADYGHLSLTCHGDVFEPSVVEHLATSLTRILGVGKRMGIVDRGLKEFTIECSGHAGAEAPVVLRYAVA